ncbi:MAG: hypothetical protein OER43_09800 [Gammaproteobacteria bacterium]|nr:hypothetical protein [Gammaproteobacteria bacterium]MDH3413088.1 hypothetical protein [Gammaproteobacteria bacterium]
MKLEFKATLGVGLFSLLFIMPPAGQAHENASSTEVLKRLQALEQRINALEAARSFASFMPDLAERFHVMHSAGEAGDWAVAAHELAEMQRLTRQSISINADQGILMQSMLGPSFENLESAIEHGNVKKFLKALENTITACNSCHVATGAQFIQVTLDAADGLSMRHPHRLMMRNAAEGHHHGPQAQSGHMMQSGHGSPDETHEHAPGTPAGHGHDAPADGGMMQQ